MVYVVGSRNGKLPARHRSEDLRQLFQVVGSGGKSATPVSGRRRGKREDDGDNKARAAAGLGGGS